jgi:hypothetical protein
MTAYIWEFGIDWNAVETVDGEYPLSYLRGCLSTASGPLPGTEAVKIGDSVTFRILDITSSVPTDPSGQWVASIDHFKIGSEAAVKGQSAVKALSSLQPAFTQDTPPPLACLGCLGFPTEPVYASWTSAQVDVEGPVGRFLLTANVRATGTDTRVRLFRLDPEMVVGASL